jgi:hypothetical protein
VACPLHSTLCDCTCLLRGTFHIEAALNMALASFSSKDSSFNHWSATRPPSYLHHSVSHGSSKVPQTCNKWGLLPAWLLPCSSIAYNEVVLPVHRCTSLSWNTIQRLPDSDPLPIKPWNIFTTFSLVVALDPHTLAHKVLSLSDHNVFSTCFQLSFGRRTLRHGPPFHANGNTIFQRLHRQQLVT